jgi:outer membrane protein assembly factor BamB
LITGGLIFGSALAASFLTTDYLKFYQETGTVVQAPVENEVRVAVIDVEENTPMPEAGNTEDIKAEEIITGEISADGESVKEAPIQEPEVVKAAGVSAPAGGSFKMNHPSFRGPWAQGISYHTGIPVDWDGPSGRNIKWKVPLPKKGYNSPVIWGDKLFFAGADNESRVVYCYNRLDGKLLWEHKVADIPGSPATPPRVTSDTGLSAPSMATDGQQVYAIFATGDIVGLDMDGKRIWAKNLSVPDNHYGHSSSLLCWKDKVIIQFDTNKSGRLLALNTLSGDISWDMPRKSKISWSSPIMAEIDNKLQIITTSSPTVAGYDFETGALLWSIDCLSGEVGPSAAYADGLVFAANEYATLVAIKPGPTPEIVWQADEYLPEAASPAVSNGLLFIATSYGMFVCYEAKTGTKLWEKEFGQGFYGSPMIADGKVYIMENNGVMHIFKVDRTLTSLGDPALGEKSVVTPAFAPGAIYLKGEKTLFCVGS